MYNLEGLRRDKDITYVRIVWFMRFIANDVVTIMGDHTIRKSNARAVLLPLFSPVAV